MMIKSDAKMCSMKQCGLWWFLRWYQDLFEVASELTPQTLLINWRLNTHLKKGWRIRLCWWDCLNCHQVQWMIFPKLLEKLRDKIWSSMNKLFCGDIKELDMYRDKMLPHYYCNDWRWEDWISFYGRQYEEFADVIRKEESWFENSRL